LRGRWGELLFALAAVCACETLPAPVTAPVIPHPTPPPAPLLAAAERVDVTPPPGVSTFGHGPDSLVSEGFWTRVECRVFALEEGDLRVALIPCDFAASSTILQREVAARVVDVVPTTRIFMTATHTHAGPAHYLDDKAFTGTESTRAPGFDPHMVEFLASRIACAVKRAFAHLVPAEARAAHFEDGEACPTGDCGMWGITWNRSVRAHLSGPADPPAPPWFTGVDAAIDPSLHWVELRAQSTRLPIGALAFYAMHPSVLPNTNRRIGADVDGVVSRLLEARLRAESGGVDVDPPVGVVNTNEGDISPVWTEGSKQEAIAVARTIEHRIEALREQASPWHDRVTLDARYREIDLRAEPASDGHDTCYRPEVGESVAFGACDHPTTEPISPWPLPPREACQAPKLTPLGELEWLVAGGGLSFPSHVPIGLIRLDDSLIALVPAELTIDAGRLVRAEVLRAQTGAGHAFIGGLSNGYILYVTSEAEYAWHGAGGGCRLASDQRDRQSYEGASNLYGPHVARYLADEMASLARAMRGAKVEGVDRAESLPYVTGPVRSRLALPSDPAVPFARSALATCALPDTRALCFRWSDGPVGDVALVDAPWIQVVSDSGAPVVGPFGAIDDRGFDFVTRVGTAGKGGSTWSTLFVVDDAEVGAIGRTRRVAIRVRGANGAAVQSEWFTLDAPPPLCAGDVAAACGDYNDPVVARPYRKGWQ
jgi:neutral ceramidase